MESLQSEVADLVFIDPPFNLGKDYGKDCKLEKASKAEYESYLSNLISEAHRVMKVGASIYVYHLPFFATRLASKLNSLFEFRHWIAVAMKNGFVRGENLYPAHYALLYYAKGKPLMFNRPRLSPKRCRHCGEYVRDYGGYRSIIEEKGINLSDFWDDLSPVRHQKRKHRSANQLPKLLTDRVLGISGVPYGLLVDPFCGTGTSLLSAAEHRMNFVGNDFDKRNLPICTERLSNEFTCRTARAHY